MLNSSSSPTVKNCTFAGNAAGYGGGMYNHDGGAVAVVNCVFVQNTAEGGTDGNYGGGICNEGSSPVAVNCTFAENAADYGGAMANNSASPTLTNCVLWGDSAETEGGELYNFLPGDVPIVTYSCVEGESGGTGNISADPLFVAAPDNVRLQAGSPCINAGTATGAPAADIEGTSRPQDGSYDMGAYEHAVK
jgi:hypothetical protein